MTRVVIYGRVSTDEQAERQTIENQLDACRSYCLQHEYEVVTEFRDEGVSGAIPFAERPEGKRLLEVAGDKLFSKVIVYCVDRLGRDVVEGCIARKELERKGAPLEFVIQSFDGTPEGELQFNIFLSFAQYERAVIRRRMMTGLRRRVKSGKYIAPTCPFGYVYNQEAGQLELHPDNAEIVRQMFRWATEGLGLKAIGARLEGDGVEPPSPQHPRRKSNWGWHFGTVYKILTAPRYMGRNTYGGTIPDPAGRTHKKKPRRVKDPNAEVMTCPVIVDEAMFNAVQQALRRRKVDSSRNTKRLYLLQHLLWCRSCGARYTPRTVREGLQYYECYHRRCYGPKAGHESVRWRWRVEELDARVKDIVRGLYTDPERSLRDVEFAVERVKEDCAEKAERIVRLERRVEKLAEEEIRIITMARKGHIDETQMLQQLDQVRAERQDVQHELKLARKVARDVDWIVEAAQWFTELAASLPMAEGFHDEATGERLEPTPEQWRDLIHNVVDKVWIEDDGSLTLEGPLGVASVCEAKTISVLNSQK